MVDRVILQCPVFQEWNFTLYFDAGYREQAESILAKFKWGTSFIQENCDLLDRYAACSTPADITAAQEAHLQQLQHDHKENREKGKKSPRHKGLSRRFWEIM